MVHQLLHGTLVLKDGAFSTSLLMPIRHLVSHIYLGVARSGFNLLLDKSKIIPLG